MADLEAGRPDRMPYLAIMRFPNDHTDGMRARRPTPQFFVAEKAEIVTLRMTRQWSAG